MARDPRSTQRLKQEDQGGQEDSGQDYAHRSLAMALRSAFASPNETEQISEKAAEDCCYAQIFSECV
jgi:hypothetical protein